MDKERQEIVEQYIDCALMELASARSSMAIAKKYSIDEFEKKMIACNIECLDRVFEYLTEAVDATKSEEGE